ncbi:aldehyde dehydrogenase family protein [Paenarthrobacter sp. DKR-5]|uniref:aldehyde dehydrogenase family protein n=1 Tax=Paenarthrobacter sp. DKR-5 TaxID=2835535 RepID=UPI001BDD4EE8|nr:aldehyde dehydrogenase family protein [Paenarthrobacter sp. DKR-5]MBT1001918.1 aldehyde dehydrogenase family protein [Paenarthrobacter sp. DKR-5]
MSTVHPAAEGPTLPAGPEREQLDAALTELAAGESRWAATGLRERAALLAAVHRCVGEEAEDWVDTAATIKNIAPGSAYRGEEWLSGPYAVLTGLAQLKSSLEALATGAGPLDKRRFGRAPGGRVTVQVLPGEPWERILLNGIRVETWMPPGVDAATVRRTAGLAEHHPDRTGGIGLVLGAGNITSIAPLDALYELIAHNRVVLLKLNPVMDALLPVFRRALRPLIEHGVLRIVTGGAKAGSYIAHHEAVAHIHITGSAATHDAIVFGTGSDGAERNRTGRPLLDKPISSELGGVSPVIVVPGRWSDRDLRFQAEHVATQRLHNAGHNCIASQVVVVSEDWPQKSRFLDELRAALNRAPAREPWYPGAVARLQSVQKSYPGAEHLRSGRLLLEAGGDPEALQTEYFAPALAVVELPGEGTGFLNAAVDKANTDLAGTLGANILVDPKTLKSLGAAFKDAVARLRYGTVAVNSWTAIGFLAAAAPWGAYPGATLEDVQSGRGVVHNAWLIDGPEKTVAHGPFREFPRALAGGEFALLPKPPWFVTARSADAAGRAMTRFAAHPAWWRMPRIFAAAFRA